MARDGGIPEGAVSAPADLDDVAKIRSDGDSSTRVVPSSGEVAGPGAVGLGLDVPEAKCLCCDGSGVEVVVRRLGGATQHTQMTCAGCHGRGVAGPSSPSGNNDPVSVQPRFAPPDRASTMELPECAASEDLPETETWDDRTLRAFYERGENWLGSDPTPVGNTGESLIAPCLPPPLLNADPVPAKRPVC